MKYAYYIYMFLVMMAVAFSSCQDHFDINQLQEDRQLVVYCFPSDKDSTDIQVSATIPLDNAPVSMPRNVQVCCFVNGKRETVHYLRNDDTDEWDKFVYRLSVIPREGDEVKIEVSAEGYPSAYATSIVPSSPCIDSISTRRVQLDGDLYTQLCVEMRDNPKTQDFYAVRVFSKWDGPYWQEREINLYAEPALSYNIMGIPTFDEDIDYYNNFYIFDDTGFSANPTYTLHLNIAGERRYYLVQLYHLAQPVYAFLRSVNDEANNELGKYGLSFTRPTFSNVMSGIGVVGGYGLEEKMIEITYKQ